MSGFLRILFVITCIVCFTRGDSFLEAAVNDGGCTSSEVWSKSITPSGDTFRLDNLLKDDKFVITTTYDKSTSGNVEVDVSVCEESKDDLLASLVFALENVESQARLTVSTKGTSSSTTASPGQNVYPSAATSSRATSLHTTFLLMAVSMFLMTKSRPSVLFVILASVYIISVNAQAATTPIQINIRIRLPETVQICDSNGACGGGDVKTFITVGGNRFALVSQTAGCDEVLKVPAGWKVSTASALSAVAIAVNTWEVEHVVVADGTAYNNHKYNDVKNTNVLTRNSDGGYTVSECGASILITQQSAAGDDIVRTVSDVKNFVTFNNNDYAVADDTTYSEQAVGRRQGVAFVETTSDWQVAADDAETRVVVHSPYTIFGAECLVVAGESAYTAYSAKCDAKLVSVPFELSGKSGNLVFATGKNARVVIRRKSSSTDNFAVAADLTKSYPFNAKEYATLDNASPYLTTAGSCQSTYLALPTGWTLAEATELANFNEKAKANAWPTTTCLVGDSNGCAGLLKATVGGKDYYATSSCGRILVARRIAKKTDFSIGMKILVVAPSDAADGARDLAVSMLSATGMHYDVINLVNGGKATYAKELPLYDETTAAPKYYGLIVTGQAVYTTGLTSAQKEQIANYKYLYGAREVVLHAYPTASTGVSVAGDGAATATQRLRVDPDFAAANPSLFAGINKNAEFAATAQHYVKVSLTSSNAKPFLRLIDAGGSPSSSAIVAAVISSDVAETLEFYIGNANFLEHSSILANVWLNWVTKETWVGSRRVYLSPHVDDHFLSTEQWDDQTIKNRLTGNDLRETKKYLEALNAPTGSNITLTFGYNAAEATEDDLFTATRETASFFYWESHTWSHLDLTCPESDCPTYGATTYEHANEELVKNIDFSRDKLWKGLGELDMPTYSKDCMITPRISGLFNPNSLKAIVDNGINCVVGDNSVKALIPENPYQGEWTSVAKHGYEGIFIIPRFATEIYYDAAFPSTEVAEYNSRYGDFGSIQPLGNKTLEEILAYEAVVTVGHLTKFRHDPYMFHQANIVHFPYTYKSGDAAATEKQWSLMTLWLQAVVDKYKEFVSFPIYTVSHHVLRDHYFARRTRDACGASAVMHVANGKQSSISATSSATCEIAFTGIKSCGDNSGCRFEKYGDDNSVWVSMAPGKTVTIKI